MTTFIDFRYSRALAAALFTGQEKEETDIRLDLSVDQYVALEAPRCGVDGEIATFRSGDRTVLSLWVDSHDRVAVRDSDSLELVSAELNHSRIVGVRVGEVVGLKVGSSVIESQWSAPPTSVVLDTTATVLGKGTGRVLRWGELYYNRKQPTGLCVQLTMDWHHLRAGIPLFGTMTAEHLIERGEFRLRFSSYAYESTDAEMTDFVKLFGSDDTPDIAVHLTPALYNPRVAGVPNLAFAVIESTSIHPHLVERCNRMDEIFVPTTFTAKVFRDAGVTRPIHVIPHGVETDYFRPPASPSPLPGGRKFNFLAVATHVERKNVRALVRCFLEEFRSSEDVALFLLLRPEYHTSQNNVALEFTEWEIEYANDSAPIYLWTGYLTRDRLRDFYANANAYVMPSNEGFGLTLLEAMSCATPVIALDHGGVTDFVNASNGTLVPKGKAYTARDVDTLPYIGDRFYEPDNDALKRAMRDVFVNQRAAKTRAARGRRDCESLFTWEKVTEQFSAQIVETYRRYHDGSMPAIRDVPPIELTLILCVMDDEPARQSLDYLAGALTPSIRALCLFTRYARIDDVLHARKLGFAYYRWNGTLDNALVIARSIVGRSWAGVLSTGERINGDLGALIAFLTAQPGSVLAVTIDDKARFFHLRPDSEGGQGISYSGLSIRG